VRTVLPLKFPLLIFDSAYGFAGTLSGTILEAPPPAKPVEASQQPAWMIFSVSAKSPDALRKYLEIYLDFCTTAPETDFRSVCYTSCVGRDLYRYRFACVVKDLDGLMQRLKDRLSQPRSLASHLPNPRIILAFPGQGSQYYGMANALAGRFGDFKTILAAAAKMASSLADFDVLTLLLGSGESTGEIDKSTVAQICVSTTCATALIPFNDPAKIFVYQYSVCQFLRKLGISAHAVIGNSLGEISGAGGMQ
jgi:acyl transferase domain-containing protein